MKNKFYFMIFAFLLVFNHSFGQTTKNVAKSKTTPALIDVWDFGAEQLDAAIYNNLLTVSSINGLYTYTANLLVGTANSTYNLFPTPWTVGILSWTGGANDRLRTTNTLLTRYDINIASVVGYTGRLYQNGSGTSNPTRYFAMTLNEDDEVTLVAKTDATGTMNFVNVATPATGQADVVPMLADLVTLKFVAKTAGNYKIYDSSGKPSYFRIYRKVASYKALTGTVDITQGSDIPAGYGVMFRNSAGKTWTGTTTNNQYSVNLPIGYTYTVSLVNANGYIITTGKTIDVTDASTTFDLSIKKVELYTVTGTITGLSSAQLARMSLQFTNTISSPFVPAPVINMTTGTYSVQLEATNTYTISALNINDYAIADNSITLGHADAIKDIVFAAKPVYAVTIDTPALNATQLGKLTLTFTNLNETGYAYTFAPGSAVTLRDGTYAISYSGLDEYAIQLGATSNLKVNGSAITKTLVFKTTTFWPFDDTTISTTTTANYRGMMITGTANTETGKTHLILKSTGATAKIPVNPGQKVIVGYYYTANFTIDGGTAITTATNSTSILESKEYVYPGAAAGYVTIANVNTTATYLTDVTVMNVVPLAATITVGADKAYQTINSALSAVKAMVRPSKERVKIMIDPGNYEEMLTIDVDSVSLVNASTTPNITLANQGVDIDANAVRITSYYGHGYNYYSMGTDQKWSADALRVNKENGYTNYSNTGSGTTNNSYWNTTVLVTAVGFQASNIIFENSYNQYISKKESEDVVLEWTSGGKGTRPTTKGSVAVQNKSFVERGAAIAYTKSGDKSILYKCRVVGRQDSFYGAEGARVVAYKGSLMGGTDYIFGGMTLVAYKSDLAMNTSEVSTDLSYITAPQQTTARGYLMYTCKVTSAQPGTETASAYLSKPGEFGRPWTASTGEAVFYNTTIEATNNPGFSGKSLIAPEGWLNTLSGTSNRCYEYGTVELSGENNAASRASWSTILTLPTLSDATAITTLNFTKGTDNWDPIPALIALENSLVSGVSNPKSNSSVQVSSKDNRIFVSNVKSDTTLHVYAVDGSLVKTVDTKADTNFAVNKGLWIVNVLSTEGNKVVKILTY